MRKALILAAAFMAMIALAVGVPVRPAAAEPSVGLSGVWLGYYGYPNSNERVQFQAKFRVAGATFAGTIIEPNTFGRSPVLFLTANANGLVGGDNTVTFQKTYDGVGGETHAVDYSGRFDASGRCIKGA